MFDLTGKTAIVTGAAGGIAQAMAIALAEVGADVAGVDVKPMDETQAEVEKLGRTFVQYQQDLGKLDEIPGLVAHIVERLGKVDILCNCAGLTDRGLPPEILPWEEYELIMNVNLNSMVKLSMEVFKRMVEQGTGGKIINVTSIMAYGVSEGSLCYTTAKNGIIGMTKVLSVAGAGHNIWVNAIAPGSIRSNMLASMFGTDKAQLEQAHKQEDEGHRKFAPARRIGLPADLKGITIYLASQASDYVAGQIICCDGGILLNDKQSTYHILAEDERFGAAYRTSQEGKA